MLRPVRPVLYVPLVLGEVLPVQQLLTQDVQHVSQDQLTVLQQMPQPVAPVQQLVLLDQPINPQRVL